jgi:hypothetical protein
MKYAELERTIEKPGAEVIIITRNMRLVRFDEQTQTETTVALFYFSLQLNQ